MSDDVVQQTGDLTGKTLGQYEIGQLLGQGGMATVYLARQTSIGRTVAIKVMPHHFLHDPSFLQRFEREVKVIATLQHPRVLPVYDYGQIDDRPFIVMAYMSGGTLADRIKLGPMPLDQVVPLVEQIAEGLDHAHHKGIIHRDFKPSNVLLDDSGNAFLADFGIAKISETTAQLTGSGIVGTPAYMAPEMAERGEVTPSVDVYALGVTLFQMLTGRYPFQGETPIRVMMAHATDPIPDVREMQPDLPEAVTAVVRKAMAKKPEERYATATEVAKALKAAARGHKPAPPEEAELRTIGLREVAPRVSAPPPAQTAVPAHTPPPVPTPMQPAVPLPQVAPTPAYPGVPLTEPKKRGCSPVLIVGGVLGVVLVAGVLLCLFAFGGLAMLGSLVATATPVPTLPPPTQEGGGVSNLTLNNQSGLTLCYLYISPGSSTDWGVDQLGSSNTVASGSSFTINDIPVGMYDLKAEDCNNNIIGVEYGADLTAGGNFTWTISPPAASLTVINNSSSAICYLYVSLSSADSWGQDQLGSAQTIPSGSTFTLTGFPPGTYDLRADTCGGQSVEQRGVTFPFEWTITD